jgi:pilus assembly protein CpaC
MGSLSDGVSPIRGRLHWLALAVALAAFSGESSGQEIARPTSMLPMDGFAPRLPIPSQTRDLRASSFREGLGESVAAIEIKVGQGRFLSLPEKLAVPGPRASFIGIGDPSVVDFFRVDDEHLRLIGKKLGSTDLSVTTSSGKTFNYEVQVVADLDLLRAQLQQMFPEAGLNLRQIRSKVVVEGQARDAPQVSRIIATIETYIRSVQLIQITGQVGDTQNVVAMPDPNAPPPAPRAAGAPDLSGSPAGANPSLSPLTGGSGFAQVTGPGGATASPGAIATNQIATGQIQVINLIRVPTSQQVLLKVRVAELNRTAFREIGADFLASVPQFKTLFGSQIAGNGYAGGAIGSGTFVGTGASAGSFNARDLSLGSQATLFGTFSGGQFNTVINALRRNNVVKILAEPNLVALNGYQAAFLAGGEFPVPSFSGVGAGATSGGGVSGTQFKKFGVQLSFLPIILDNDTIRLSVNPDVSSVDFSVATTLVPGGSPVPGLNTRSAYTTVELKQGETLAIAGLLQLTLDGETQKLPGLGDLPYIGAFFSNTSSTRTEKELVVTITPYIIEPMAPGQVPPGPGDEVREPNDLEFFFLNRIEGRTGIDKRSTTSYDDPLHLIRNSIVEKKYLIGPSGYSK